MGHVSATQGKPEGWQPRPHSEPHPDRPDWFAGSFRFDCDDSASRELMALGLDVEVLLPVDLRDAMADIGRRIAALHESPSG